MSSLLLALLLQAAPGPGASLDRSAHRLTLGVTSVDYDAVFRATADPLVAELSYGYVPSGRWAPLELGGGLRLTRARPGVRVPGEVFVRARLEARFGTFAWRPAAGPEVGLSGLLVPGPRTDAFPEDLDQVEARRLSPLYLSVDLAPLRFFFRGFTLSAMELSLGAPLFPSGTALRTELGLVSLGYQP